MVAPLYVVVAVMVQGIHDNVSSWTAVVDVAEDVESVNAESLYYLADGLYERFRLACGDDGVEDAAVIVVLVLARRSLVQQLLNDICELAWQRLAYLGAGIFRRHPSQHLHKLVESDVVDVLHVRFLLAHQLEFLARIVDEGTELVDVVLPHVRGEEFVHLALDVSRSVLEDMAERLVFAVNVGHEVLGAFGQIEDSLQVDDLGGGRLDGGEALRQHLQKPPVLLYLGARMGVVVHGRRQVRLYMGEVIVISRRMYEAGSRTLLL